MWGLLLERLRLRPIASNRIAHIKSQRKCKRPLESGPYKCLAERGGFKSPPQNFLTLLGVFWLLHTDVEYCCVEPRCKFITASPAAECHTLRGAGNRRGACSLEVASRALKWLASIQNPSCALERKPSQFHAFLGSTKVRTQLMRHGRLVPTPNQSCRARIATRPVEVCDQA